MELKEIVEQLDLTVRTGRKNLDTEVAAGYASDLMSDVIAHAREGSLWVTLQIHQNIVAVASMNDLAGVILVNGREPEGDTIEKAEAEGLPIMVTPLPTFEVVGRLYGLGISGIPRTG